MWPDDVRDRATAADLCEWAVYLNSPFSARGRDTFMNGWLVHTIRSILADKRHRPKFADSVFPFEKLYREFFAKSTTTEKLIGGKGKRAQKTLGEVLHGSQVLRQRFEKALADFKAGRITNRFGLKYGERIKA